MSKLGQNVMSKRLLGSFVQSLSTKWKILPETCMMLDHNNRFQFFDKLLERHDSVWKYLRNLQISDKDENLLTRLLLFSSNYGPDI